MISFLRGKLFACHQESIIIEVNGIGLEVYIHSRSFSGLPAVGSEIFIYTFLQVLENEFKLYGFMNKEELELFKVLLGVSGVGSKLALGILGAVDPGKFGHIISSQDIKSLTKIPGVGKKTAERLVFELKDKIGLPIFKLETDNSADTMFTDILEAMEALGYSRSEMLPVLMELKQKGELGDSVEANIKKLLRTKALHLPK
ncbi:MAG: Holliday junction branch migration protein RuvA [Syntrophomonadaceae bacterium]|jgi:Holliday junction DNA helicase RuvA